MNLFALQSRKRENKMEISFILPNHFCLSLILSRCFVFIFFYETEKKIKRGSERQRDREIDREIDREKETET